MDAVLNFIPSSISAVICWTLGADLHAAYPPPMRQYCASKILLSSFFFLSINPLIISV